MVTVIRACKDIRQGSMITMELLEEAMVALAPDGSTHNFDEIVYRAAKNLILKGQIIKVTDLEQPNA